MRLFLFLAVCACAYAVANQRALPYSLRSDTGVTHHDRVWAMKLAPNADPRLIARRLHLVYVKPIFEGAYHIFREPSEEGRDGVRRIGQEQVARGAERDHDVVWFEKQTFRTQQKRTEVSVPGNLSSAGFLMSPQTESMLNSRYSRAVVERMKSRMIEEIARAPSNDPAHGPNPMTVLDPQFPNQWHLRAAHPVGVKADYVWNMHESFRGQQSHIAIVDDGIHALLPDLRSQVDLEISGTFSASGNGQVIRVLFFSFFFSQHSFFPFLSGRNEQRRTRHLARQWRHPRNVLRWCGSSGLQHSLRCWRLPQLHIECRQTPCWSHDGFCRVASAELPFTHDQRLFEQLGTR